jgi:PAS domain S-box-containing protein
VFGYLLWPLPISWLWYSTGALEAALFVFLLAAGPGRGALANPVIVAGAAIAMAQTWVANDLTMRAGTRFHPFEVYKLFSLAVALLAPSSLWIGVGAIAATAVLPLVQTYRWPVSIRQVMPPGEPGVTMFYALVALILLLHRRRQLTAQRDLIRIETKAAYIDRFMRKFLAVRDLANSPVQSLETTLAVLRLKHPDTEPQLERIERQIDRLRKLSTVLSQYEPQSWSTADESFDPLEVLQQAEDSPTKEIDRLFLVPAERGDMSRRDVGAESKVQQLLRFTSFGLEHSPVPAFWLGEDGRVVYANRASCVSLGYTRSELLGMHICGFAPQISREEWPRRFDSFRRAQSRPYRSVHRRKDGSLVPVEIAAFFTELNGYPYVLGFARELPSPDPDSGSGNGSSQSG